MEDTIVEVFGNYGQLALSIVGVFAIIATMIPSPNENSGKVYKIFYSLLSWLAANVGKAKNAASQTTTTSGTVDEGNTVSTSSNSVTK